MEKICAQKSVIWSKCKLAFVQLYHLRVGPHWLKSSPSPPLHFSLINGHARVGWRGGLEPRAFVYAKETPTIKLQCPASTSLLKEYPPDGPC